MNSPHGSDVLLLPLQLLILMSSQVDVRAGEVVSSVVKLRMARADDPIWV
jgi:hypothetical protein